VRCCCQVLRYFTKVCTAEATVAYTLTDRDVSNWDVSKKVCVKRDRAPTTGRVALVLAQGSRVSLGWGACA
jgi:hypothetical protein